MTETEIEIEKQEGDTIAESQSQLDNKDEEKKEDWYWIPKIEREVMSIDEDTVEVCPSLLWLNKRKKLKCRKLKRSKR